MNIIGFSKVKISLIKSSIAKDFKTIAIIIPNKSDMDEIKENYVSTLSRHNIFIKHKEDLIYKSPFWKFWENDLIIAVFEIQNWKIE
jgi:hypothetical protein